MSGGTCPVVYAETNLKDKYADEYTSEVLPPHLSRDAMIDELDYFNSRISQLATTEEMKNIPDYILVKSQRVLCNKGDSSEQDVRAHLVSCEINKDGKTDSFSASTPPLEGKKLLLTKITSQRAKKLRVSFVDIKKAYFTAIPAKCS